MTRLDRLALLTITIALLLLGAVISLGNRVPIGVRCLNPGPCSEISPFGAVVFEFSRPVDRAATETLWRSEPVVDGRWEWIDERSVRWIARSALPAGQRLQLQFAAGQVGKNGEPLHQAAAWSVRVRAALVTYVQVTQDSQELYSIALEEGAAPRQLTHTGGRVFDYAPAPDGEAVVFSVFNAKKGFDLWIVNRDGSGERKLLDCGYDRCQAPAWSPVERALTYTRENAGVDPEGPRGAPRIWLLNLDNGETAPFSSDPQKIGYGAIWSPDGQWLSIWNGAAGGIEVASRQGTKSAFFKSSSGDTGCWSIDSRFLYYSELVERDGNFSPALYRGEIINETTIGVEIADQSGAPLGLNNPVCSPVDGWVALTIQPDPQQLAKELFLVNPDTAERIPVFQGAERIPIAYAWTPAGERLVFQLEMLGGGGGSEIWAWERKTGQTRLLVSGMRYPNWLP